MEVSLEEVRGLQVSALQNSILQACLIENCASRYRAFDRSARKIRTIEIGIAEVNNNRVALRGFARQDIKVPSTDILSVLRDPSTVKADRDAIEANDREMLPYYVGW